jgi:hypothetical protein
MDEETKIYLHRPTDQFIVGNPPRYHTCKVVRVRDVHELLVDVLSWRNVGQVRRRVELCGNKLEGVETESGICAKCQNRFETAGDVFAAFDAPLDQK